MASVKYDIVQALTNKNQAKARGNIGLLPDCLNYVHELAVYADYMFYGLKHVSKESVEEWFNFLKNSPTLVSHVGTFRECAHNENLPDDWK